MNKYILFYPYFKLMKESYYSIGDYLYIPCKSGIG